MTPEGRRLPRAASCTRCFAHGSWQQRCAKAGPAADGGGTEPISQHQTTAGYKVQSSPGCGAGFMLVFRCQGLLTAWPAGQAAGDPG